MMSIEPILQKAELRLTESLQGDEEARLDAILVSRSAR